MKMVLIVLATLCGIGGVGLGAVWVLIAGSDPSPPSNTPSFWPVGILLGLCFAFGLAAVVAH